MQQDGSSFRLIVRRGPQPNQVYDLNKGVLTIGRDITNDIVINDPEVSRHHCRLTQGGGGFTIEDLGSTNGTFVNGQRLTGARPLSHGDMLGLGETVTLAYETASAGAPAAPPGGGPVSTMVGGGAPPGSEYYGRSPVASPYDQPRGPSTPPPYQGEPPPYGAPQQQQSMGYDSDYYQDDYVESGAGRWVILGCGCFLVLCIVTSVVGGIIIDATCSWDDIPIISEMFDLGVKPGACE